MIGAALVAEALAVPVPRTRTYCVNVHVSFNDEEGGDRWTGPPADRPARGFRAELRRHGTNAVVWSGHLAESGAQKGCTPLVVVSYDPASPGAYEYYLRVWSTDAEVAGNVVDAVNAAGNGISTDAVTFDRAVASGQAVYPVVNGDAQSIWKMLAFTTFALATHDGGVDGDYTIVQQAAGAEYQCNADEVRLSASKRGVYGHELGHGVADEVGGGCIDFGPEADPDDCGVYPDAGGWLTKEWQGLALGEGVASWYLATVLNEANHGDTCEIPYFFAIDWNSDGNQDVGGGEPSLCYGDPWTDDFDPAEDTWVGTGDWLTGALAAGAGGCHGSLDDRNNRFEVTRYFWEMTTVYDYTVAEMWAVWAAADPSTWDPDASDNVIANDPNARMHAGAAVLGAGGQADHDAAAAAHGVNR